MFSDTDVMLIVDLNDHVNVLIIVRIIQVKCIQMAVWSRPNDN